MWTEVFSSALCSTTRNNHSGIFRRDYCSISEPSSSFCPDQWKRGCSGLNGGRAAEPKRCCFITASDRTCMALPTQNIVRLPASSLECHAADPGEGRMCLTPLAVLTNLKSKLLEGGLWFLVQISKWNHARHGCPVHFSRKEFKHCSAAALLSIQVHSFLDCIVNSLF